MGENWLLKTNAAEFNKREKLHFLKSLSIFKYYKLTIKYFIQFIKVLKLFLKTKKVQFDNLNTVQIKLNNNDKT